MCTILSIETATPACSCALSRDGELLLSREDFGGQTHATLLGVFVDEIMKYVRKEGITLDAIAVSSGPGSYTGLRIGVSEAKGLSYGLGIPLIAIPTPLVMASMVAARAGEEDLLCPMIDARRMEVYATFYNRTLETIRPTAAAIVDGESYLDLLSRHKVHFFGNGADKCRAVITHPNALFVEDIHPLATGMVPLAEQAFNEKRFVDSAYFEPHYLKEFVATVAKNKIIPTAR
ncbi:MAG TPA: tRNA (adenosine(37)-N6)-threonylcarbamoyltransferase complex dimerization subunit type 1 TsaB [Proteiniphilum sp.]|nr:tRNA (adenosine(37)-N6)-threonylcarbamoyltransferase complex dimerization subunit type 1 TsaB [Proteiniphilum sp.]HPD86640.1 tRNA (adenosine(37)-N6)-threonylcarbamoyltransferase complex dimerization subunit type 1 TsaB [Proteiniphilum sp.]HPJ50388.1 tRNA (adenosine(37)-N6)-threonylcarbamoyltransferase complex dimerization subunit type 1 TsaB [Proteiniphilum sp.]HPR20796.1 tRNA (adenosine(37)-N6)-threonylcarbamoyltransferase complex dimerization subunit type 1 TsaB [Proteiniphilum sp.]